MIFRRSGSVSRIRISENSSRRMRKKGLRRRASSTPGSGWPSSIRSVAGRPVIKAAIVITINIREAATEGNNTTEEVWEAIAMATEEWAETTKEVEVAASTTEALAAEAATTNKTDTQTPTTAAVATSDEAWAEVEEEVEAINSIGTT